MMRAIQESTYLKCIIFAFFGKSSEMSRFISTQRTLSSFMFIAIIVSNHFYSWIDYMTLRKDKHWDVFHISIVSPRWSAPTTYLSYDDQHRLIFSNYRKEDKCKHFRRIPSKLKIFLNTIYLQQRSPEAKTSSPWRSNEIYYSIASIPPRWLPFNKNGYTIARENCFFRQPEL